MPTILVIEDEESIAEPMVENLEFEGYEVLDARDGNRGLELALSGQADLVLLDIMLPGVNGYEICRRMREEGIDTPVIMLTARGEEADKVRGLDIGADDYLTKPVGILELMARIRAGLRRSDSGNSGPTGELLEFGKAHIDFGRFEALVDEQPVHLSPKEFGILKLLWERAGKAVSRADILQQVWGYDVYPTTRTVDTHVADLRAKLEEDPADPQHILTVHGTGYRLAL
jgi:DNA-binding response OmpR family regulator